MSNRHMGEAADRAACTQLNQDFETRTVFLLANEIEADIGDESLGERLIDAARYDDGEPDFYMLGEEVVSRANDFLTRVKLPAGWMLAGVGDIGTAADPVYGLVDFNGVDMAPDKDSR